MPDSFNFTPVDHDPFSEDSGPVLERIPPQMNIPAQQQWGAQAAADVLGNVTGISDAAKAWRGEMTPEEQRNFALTAAAGMIPGARALKPAVQAAEEVAPAVARGIRAYHGSPYDFDRFDLSKIGTGEGSQSHAHGIYVAENQAVAQHYKDLRRSPTGRMYEVSIDATPDQFIDIEKAFSQQSPHVQTAIEKAGIVNKDQGAGWGFRPEDAQRLAEAGISGVKYLDQGSRGRETSIARLPGNIYVVRNGAGVHESPYFHSEQEALNWKRENPDRVTHNYVVFNDKLLNIIKKYGLAGLTTMGAAHFSTTPVEGDPFEEKKRAAGGRVNAANIDTEPTEAQKKAGNYAKDHVSIHGLDITIENAKGHERRGVDKGGKAWAVRMPCAYGYLKRTLGKDGDHVDVYLGNHLKSPKVFVIDQKNADTGRFDEHKTFLGFASEQQVRACYAKAFSDGKAHLRLGHIEEMMVEQFKHWLANGDTTKPIKNGEDKKLPHSTVGYVATSPHIAKYCGVCSMFVLAGPHCTLVDDPVRAGGYCKRFYKGKPHGH